MFWNFSAKRFAFKLKLFMYKMQVPANTLKKKIYKNIFFFTTTPGFCFVTSFKICLFLQKKKKNLNTKNYQIKGKQKEKILKNKLMVSLSLIKSKKEIQK